MLTQDQIIRLQDIGISACHSGAVYEARKIFDGLLTLRPGNTAILIGKALSHIVVDEFPEAEDILQNHVLAEHPDDAEAEIMLGLCFILSGQYQEARCILGKAVQRQAPSGQLARNLLAGFG